MTSAATYPAGLPCPAVAITTPAERRLLSDLPGPRQAHALQRDYAARERVDFPPLTQEQADTFMAWWRDDLGEGGAWFAADWPTPQGGRVVRRFAGPLKWAYIHAGIHRRMWRVSGECEVSGRWAAPVTSDVWLRLPFDGTIADASPYRRPVSLYTTPGAQPEPLTGATAAGVFGSALRVAYGLTGTSGVSNSILVYSVLPPFTGDFTIQLWVRATQYPVSVPIASNGIRPEYNSGLSGPGAWALKFVSPTAPVEFDFWNDAEATKTTRLLLAAPAGTDVWLHLAIVRRAGVLQGYQGGFAQGAPVAFAGPIGGVYPVTVGGNRHSGPLGIDAWVSGGNPAPGGYIDDVMISAVAEYAGSFTPPAVPLRLK